MATNQNLVGSQLRSKLYSVHLSELFKAVPYNTGTQRVEFEDTSSSGGLTEDTEDEDGDDTTDPPLNPTLGTRRSSRIRKQVDRYQSIDWRKNPFSSWRSPSVPQDSSDEGSEEEED